jgi:hypothetical protein
MSRRFSMMALGALALLVMLAASADAEAFAGLWPWLQALLYVEP